MLNKTVFTVAALAAVASTRSVANYNDQINLVNDPKLLVADFKYDLDFNYHTEFFSGMYYGEDAPGPGY